MSRVPIFAVLAIGLLAGIPSSPQTAGSPPAEKVVGRKSPPAISLSQADRDALTHAAERLERTPQEGAAQRADRQPTEIEKSPERARLEATTRGTSEVVRRLAAQDEVQLTSEQKELVLQAVAEAEAVQQETATRAPGKADVERAQQAEKRVVLTYWNTPLAESRKTETLAPYQLAYVFEQQFQTLGLAVQGTQATEASLEDFQRACQTGAENAVTLSRQTDLPRSPELGRLLSSSCPEKGDFPARLLSLEDDAEVACLLLWPR